MDHKELPINKIKNVMIENDFEYKREDAFCNFCSRKKNPHPDFDEPIVVRDLKTGKIETHTGEAVVLCSGGYGNVFFLSTNGKNSNATAAWRCHKKGAFMANPCFTQIHPTCIFD